MATLDLLTLDEARAAVMAPDQRYDEQLALMNTAISLRLDRKYGPIVARSVVERHDGGDEEIRPRQLPIYSITSLVEYRYTVPTTLTLETLGTAPSDAYLIDPDGSIDRRSGGYCWTFWPGDQNIVLTYMAGRYASTATVDAHFKQAAAITLAHMWRNEQGSGNQTFGGEQDFTFGASFSIPNRALELLAGEIRSVGIA